MRTFQKKKINNEFEINKTIEIEDEEKEKCEYELASLLIHQGSATGGHYFCYVRDDVGEWLSCNDSVVQNYTHEEFDKRLEEHCGKGAYLLLYKKKEKVWGAEKEKEKLDTSVPEKLLAQIKSEEDEFNEMRELYQTHLSVVECTVYEKKRGSHTVIFAKKEEPYNSFLSRATTLLNLHEEDSKCNNLRLTKYNQQTKNSTESFPPTDLSLKTLEELKFGSKMTLLLEQKGKTETFEEIYKDDINLSLVVVVEGENLDLNLNLNLTSAFESFEKERKKVSFNFGMYEGGDEADEEEKEFENISVLQVKLRVLYKKKEKVWGAEKEKEKLDTSVPEKLLAQIKSEEDEFNEMRELYQTHLSVVECTVYEKKRGSHTVIFAKKEEPYNSFLSRATTLLNLHEEDSKCNNLRLTKYNQQTKNSTESFPPTDLSLKTLEELKFGSKMTLLLEQKGKTETFEEIYKDDINLSLVVVVEGENLDLNLNLNLTSAFESFEKERKKVSFNFGMYEGGDEADEEEKEFENISVLQVKLRGTAKITTLQDTITCAISDDFPKVQIFSLNIRSNQLNYLQVGGGGWDKELRNCEVYSGDVLLVVCGAETENGAAAPNKIIEAFDVHSNALNFSFNSKIGDFNFDKKISMNKNQTVQDLQEAVAVAIGEPSNSFHLRTNASPNCEGSTLKSQTVIKLSAISEGGVVFAAAGRSIMEGEVKINVLEKIVGGGVGDVCELYVSVNMTIAALKQKVFEVLGRRGGEGVEYLRLTDKGGGCCGTTEG